ncbi:Late embryogenesis abundant protein 2 [Turneriella parva DSM 21527]|uniref:Late embryogenesis abundant protein 2 n=1 Tax=Turneriella parva (strain ATCC BAA-1111 / DSM 21527 / NCTC 11395 / H) TaxID=869212 RepID=I4BBZ0_TURPD|nr:Late embryogenesis abundant protein 2 [Turneriella parva DSM 21527]
MLRRSLAPALIAVAIAGSLQCASLVKTIFNPPQVGVDRVEFRNVALTGTDLVVHIKIHNPNSVGATLNHIEYALDVDGDRLLNGKKEDKTEIKSNDTSIIALPVTINYTGLKSGIAGALSKKTLPYGFKGKVILDTPVGAMNFDINEAGEIPVPDRPRFDIEKIALAEFGVTSATLMIHIKVSNNHDFELDIRKFRYEFSLQDNLISAANINVDRSVAHDKSMSIALPVTLKVLGVKRSVIDMIKSGKIKYAMKFDLDIQTRFGPMTIPYERDGLTSLY